MQGKQRLEEFRRLQDHLEAMRCCLLQILEEKGTPYFFSLYRAMMDKELRFNGALVCDPVYGKPVYEMEEVCERGRISDG